jgi:hypothetical protein
VRLKEAAKDMKLDLDSESILGVEKERFAL